MNSTATVTCLIVDDIEDNLTALAALLDEPGVEILRARSAREALELLLVNRVALAILDVQMPEIDGFELAEMMRGSVRTHAIPIIFVTAGLADQRRVFKGYESGAVDFLLKPIEGHVLKGKARVFFQLYRQQIQLAEDLCDRTETLRMTELFTAMLAHDLRGPLGAIVMSSMVVAKTSTDALIQQMASRAVSSARSMSRMIEDMLDLSRSRIGDGIAVRRVRGDLEAALRRVADECSAAHPDRCISWVAAGDFTGDWDTDRLSQVASNLIRNAIRHGDGKVPVRVDMDGRDASTVSLKVFNDGHIPPELLPNIFEPFRSREMTSARGEGLGIGLYIVREIVRAHHGSIEVASSQRSGTTFTVILPRNQS